MSSYFKGQLDDLMTTLYKTEPHFIRCVVPNTHKQPRGVEPDLIMHQYQVLTNLLNSNDSFTNHMVLVQWCAGRYCHLPQGFPQQNAVP